ncbi:hypothetical protein [Laribacter hongkongensis]|uniref:hypothetical protein n=1 Tax=Laribacter hongkongensis TaxID=168471 RepID=UPI001EFE643C|nr:hypothetical protein [Laribacter hongkongensis]MCG8994656.1 hypothetical protein [Laribacter hongkongensis]MCG9009439.1 hypothetical protein [Laribacter hongkongensis]MCG9021902.1 hypothetical protein [Laribacter hongkongensis]MCG9045725.1 hypothetical protein [Laribacter hongkongensis]MCG9072842.1 hypothetical protein [Laribacter hongkongensis]
MTLSMAADSHHPDLSQPVLARTVIRFFLCVQGATESLDQGDSGVFAEELLRNAVQVCAVQRCAGCQSGVK